MTSHKSVWYLRPLKWKAEENFQCCAFTKLSVFLSPLWNPTAKNKCILVKCLSCKTVKMLNICFDSNLQPILSCELYSKWTCVHFLCVSYFISFTWPMNFVLLKLCIWGHLSLTSIWNRSQHTFYVRGQVLNSLGFPDYAVSVENTQPCYCSARAASRQKTVVFTEVGQPAEFGL